MIIIFLSFILFSSVTLVHKTLLDTVSPGLLVSIRSLIAGCIIITFNQFLIKKKINHVKIPIHKILLMAAFIIFFPGILKAYSLTYLRASQTAFLESFNPCITATYAYLMRNEPLSNRQILGIICACIGNIALHADCSLTQINCPSTALIFSGIALVASMIVNRHGWIEAKKFLKNSHGSLAEFIGLIMITGGIYSLLYSYCCETWSNSFFTLSLQSYALLGYSIIIGNIVGYMLYGYLIKNYSINTITTWSLSIPCIIQLYETIIMHEPYSLLFFVALSLLLFGTIIVIPNKQKI